MSFQTDLYDKLLADILTLTNRPDLEAETELALRTATINAHHSDFYNRDHRTQLVQLPNPSYNSALDIQNLFPRFRGLETVQLLDVNYIPINDPEIEIIEIGDILDSEYRFVKNNVAYVAGTTLNIRSNINSYGYSVGWYSSPQTRREEYNSWIAQLYDPVIVFWGAAIVLGTNGNEEKANRYGKMVEQQMIPYMKANYLVGKAR